MTIQLTEEGWYRYQERLGILCGADVPTPRQHDMALGDALDWDTKHGRSMRRTREVKAPPSKILDAE